MRVIKLNILVGDSGSGKNHTLKILESNGFKKIVTDTTRRPREDEVDGVDYNFTTKDIFRSRTKIESNDLYGVLYGLMEESFLKTIKEHDKVSVILDPNGMLALLDYLDNPDIFPNIEETFDINIIYLNIPKEVRFHRLVTDYMTNDKYPNTDYLKEIQQVDVKEIPGVAIMTMYKYSKMVIDRMNRISEDEDGLTIFDKILNPEHSKYSKLRYYLDNIYCKLLVFNYMDKISIDTFLSENNII